MKVKLDPNAYMPERAHPTDAGLDIRTPVQFHLRPRESCCINTGVHIQLPPNTVGMLKSKSGLNVRYSILSEGVIDEGYTGSIVAKLYNHGDAVVSFEKGDKITQLVVLPVLYVDVEETDVLEGGERGDSGFGSTGRA